MTDSSIEIRDNKLTAIVFIDRQDRLIALDLLVAAGVPFYFDPHHSSWVYLDLKAWEHGLKDEWIRARHAIYERREKRVDA